MKRLTIDHRLWSNFFNMILSKQIKHTISYFFIFLYCSIAAFAQENYEFTEDSKKQEGVPQGTVTTYEFKSKIFENTDRKYYVYVPAQYDGSKAAAVMVFQDGRVYVNENRQFRTTIVFDNLIHKKKMPVTIGIFIDPGVIIPKNKDEKSTRNRSFEYDDLSDNYVRFLTEEIIPEVAKKYKLTNDRKMRAICGISSGGICAFNAAWHRPDYFHKVMSHVGSFTNIRGGHVYHALVRAEEKKDIRVFLQDGANDLDNHYGNWWLANQEMASSLKYKGYDYTFIKGEGGHSGKHGGAILPESMRWLWRGWDE